MIFLAKLQLSSCAVGDDLVIVHPRKGRKGRKYEQMGDAGCNAPSR